MRMASVLCCSQPPLLATHLVLTFALLAHEKPLECKLTWLFLNSCFKCWNDKNSCYESCVNSRGVLFWRVMVTKSPHSLPPQPHICPHLVQRFFYLTFYCTHIDTGSRVLLKSSLSGFNVWAEPLQFCLSGLVEGKTLWCQHDCAP